MKILLLVINFAPIELVLDVLQDIPESPVGKTVHAQPVQTANLSMFLSILERTRNAVTVELHFLTMRHIILSIIICAFSAKTRHGDS